MKEQLIQLSIEKGFIAEFTDVLVVVNDNFYHIWLCESQKWLS
jgi:hypothetical protein